MDKKAIEPLQYDLFLKPDFEKWITSGTVRIKLRFSQPAERIRLHQVDLNIVDASIQSNGQQISPDIESQNEKQRVNFECRQKISGKATIEIDFEGKITDSLLGLYRSHYYQENKKKYILVTQLEEREARKVFPCLDHPRYKAPINISLEIPSKYTAISNTPIQAEKIEKGKTKIVSFEQSPPMCTYTTFIGVGDFEFLSDDSQSPLIRIAGPPGRVKFGKFGLDVARKCMNEMVNYTGVPYPLEKCDHIAVQDFAFGAMENWGAVTYRENLLLVYPNQTTKENKVRIANVIIHETSHMWFGNLVSPVDWKYIWLNESFASFFTYHVTNVLFPQWEVWDDFYLSDYLGGLERDAYRKTHPIELKGDKEFKIDSSTSPIIYNKGASVLRMLIAYLGEPTFKKACQKFLKRHQYESVSTKEYWKVFNKVSDRPVDEFVDTWVYQGGFPFIKVKKTNEGRQLVITQERFTFLNDQESKTHLWLVPLSVKWLFEKKEPKVDVRTMETKDYTLKVPENATGFSLNANQTGFYRVLYERDMREEIGKAYSEEKYNIQERFGILNDLFAFVRKGDVDAKEYLDFVEKHVMEEKQFLPLDNLLGHLHFISRRRADLRRRAEKIGKEISRFNLEILGLEPQESESVHDSGLRSRLLWTSAKFGSQEHQKWGLKAFEKTKEGNPAHPELKGAALKIGAAFGHNAEEFLFKKYLDKQTTQAEKMQLIAAMVHLPGKEKVQRVIDFALGNMSRNNKWIPFRGLSANLAAEPLLWNWFKEHLEQVLKEFQASYLGRVLKSVVSCAPVQQHDKIVKFFEAHKESFSDTWESVEIALEYYKILENIRK